MASSINLFQTQTSLPPVVVVIQTYLQKIQYIVLGTVCLLGVLTLGMYTYLRYTTQTIDTTRATLTTSIQQKLVKEGLLLTLRARVASLKKIMQVQQSIAPYIDVTLLLARPPRLTSFSLGEQNAVSISIAVPSVDEAVSTVTTLIALYDQNRIRNPQLTSLTIDSDQTVTLGLVYTVVLQ